MVFVVSANLQKIGQDKDLIVFDTDSRLETPALALAGPASILRLLSGKKRPERL